MEGFYHPCAAVHVLLVVGWCATSSRSVKLNICGRQAAGRQAGSRPAGRQAGMDCQSGFGQAKQALVRGLYGQKASQAGRQSGREAGSQEVMQDGRQAGSEAGIRNSRNE